MTYYNEFDPKAAAWLRELIRAGLIPAGDVDERSISDVRPDELTGYAQQHFFAGIGGWAFALRLAGWPDNRPVRTGSCPCQPFSAAGKGLGEADARHLWPVFRDLITFGEPTITFGEQVASAPGRIWLSRVRADLEGLGYGVGAADLCSAGVGSPNIRQRLFWMADAQGEGRTRVEPKRATRFSERSRAGRDCSTRRLADPKRPEWRQVVQSDERNRSDAGWDEAASRSGARCEDGRMANANGGQSGHGDLQSSGQHRQQPQDGGACGLGDANSRGGAPGVSEPSQREEGDAGIAHDPSGSFGFWSAYDLLPCTDGKARRIEPGSFPLAHGVSGRVGLLRGYGNAINPWLAAEFILACEEALA